MKNYIAKALVGALVICGIAIAVYFLIITTASSPTTSYIDRKLAREKSTFNELKFNLVDPSEAPENIRKLAKQGYEILINTQKNASEFVGGKLDCTNCHFAGGNTTGGVQGGISLVGVSTKYPAYDYSMKKVIDLPARVNNCFKKSMNGKPLPLDSELMLAIVTYLQWISKDLPIYGLVPWLGLDYLQTTHAGNPDTGKKLYEAHCASCHRDNGEGGTSVPPLWGKFSFNNEAGFNNPEKLSAFIYWNMPYFESTPVLSQEEAMDVAAYIIPSHAQKCLNNMFPQSVKIDIKEKMF